jgi:hypothetical protein
VNCCTSSNPEVPASTSGSAEAFVPAYFFGVMVTGTSIRSGSAEPVVAVIVPPTAFGPASRRKTNVTDSPGASSCPAVQITVPLPAGQPTVCCATPLSLSKGSPSRLLPGPTTLTSSGRDSVNVVGGAGAEPVLRMVMGSLVGGPPVDVVKLPGAVGVRMGAALAVLVVFVVPLVGTPTLDPPAGGAVAAGDAVPVAVGLDEVVCPVGAVVWPVVVLDAGG